MSSSGGNNLNKQLALAMAIAIKNNMMKKRGKEAAEVFFKKVLEELKKAIKAQKGAGKQKKKIQKGGNKNPTRSVEEILKEMASYIEKYPNTISVFNEMYKKTDPEVKDAIKENKELKEKLDLEESAPQQPEENPTSAQKQARRKPNTTTSNNTKTRSINTKIRSKNTKIRSINTKIRSINTKIRSINTKIRSINTKIRSKNTKIRSINTKIRSKNNTKIRNKSRRSKTI